jgi:hypothetical protein
MIGFHLRHLKATEAAIADLDRRIEVRTRPFRDAIDVVAEVPGAKRVAAADSSPRSASSCPCSLPMRICTAGRA